MDPPYKRENQAERRAFLAHELGHYLLHRADHPNGIRCGEQDIVRWDSAYGQIELCDALRQTLATGNGKIVVTRQALSEEAKPLEHGAVAELISDRQQLIARRILALEIRREARFPGDAIALAQGANLQGFDGALYRFLTFVAARFTDPDFSRSGSPRVDGAYWIAMFSAGVFGTVAGDLIHHGNGLYSASGALCSRR